MDYIGYNKQNFKQTNKKKLQGGGKVSKWLGKSSNSDSFSVCVSGEKDQSIDTYVHDQCRY